MKRIVLAALLIFSLLLSSCQGLSAETPAKKLLDGKKVAFLGCSYTFRTYTVHKGMGMPSGMGDRAHDQETFYQFCKAKGAEVDVLDWTFSKHSLSDLVDLRQCKRCSRHHLDDLTDRYYDYVVMHDIFVFSTAEEYLQIAEKTMALFREANPNVQFYYVLHNGTYSQNYTEEWREAITLIENAGAKFIDWASLVWDIINGQTEVPGAKYEYNKQSFIISQSPTDGYHPNPLVGYLYSLMVYCAITGEKAVGQPYAFMTTQEQLEKWENYKRVQYTYDDSSTERNERDTKFVEILSSAEDVKGLQTLVDSYMSKPSKAVSKYRIRFANEDGSLIEEKEYYYGKTVECADPQKPGDEKGEYEFAGWDKPLSPCVEAAEYKAVYRKKQ